MKGLKLLIIAKILGLIARPFQFFYHLYLQINLLFSKSHLKEIDNKFLALAILKDKYCNEQDADLLNALFLTEDSVHPFGNKKETISSVLGKNLLAGTLTKRGLEICETLNSIQANHVLISIDNTI